MNYLKYRIINSIAFLFLASPAIFAAWGNPIPPLGRDLFVNSRADDHLEQILFVIDERSVNPKISIFVDIKPAASATLQVKLREGSFYCERVIGGLEIQVGLLQIERAHEVLTVLNSFEAIQPESDFLRITNRLDELIASLSDCLEPSRVEVELFDDMAALSGDISSEERRVASIPALGGLPIIGPSFSRKENRWPLILLNELNDK